MAKGDSRLAGTFKMELPSDGTFEMSNEFDGVSVPGRYTVEGDQLQILADKGCARGGFPERATYRFVAKGSKLRFTAIDEKCGGRRQTLTYPVWEKVE